MPCSMQVAVPTVLKSTSSSNVSLADGVRLDLRGGSRTDCSRGGVRADGGWPTELTFKT